MRVVYVAGPYTAPNAWVREQNIRRAEEFGFLVAEAGAMPLIPHANTRFFDGLQTPAFWYEGTLELLRRCDAIIVVEGFELSRGTKAEIAEAERIGLPVFMPNEYGRLRAWVELGAS